MKIWMKYCTTNVKKLEYKSIVNVAVELSQNYRTQFPFVKNRGFKEENEWRIAVCSGIGHYNIPGSDEIFFSKMKYRVANNKLIPYIDIFNGYYDGWESGYDVQTPITISKSITSYR